MKNACAEVEPPTVKFMKNACAEVEPPTVKFMKNVRAEVELPTVTIPDKPKKYPINIKIL